MSFQRFRRVRSWLRANAMPGVYRFTERFGFHIYPVHYYSPLPSIRELKENPALWSGRSELGGIDMRLEAQLQLVDTLSQWQTECEEAVPNYASLVSDQSLGAGYGEIEALILHAMIRYLRPRRIIEVGSGYSTYVSSQALNLNANSGELICIEPYPYEELQKLQGVSQLIPQKVQAVPRSFFRQLDENDILFIDSSHIVKVGSDVVYLFLEVLPVLRPGVVVHVHDIGFPYWRMQPLACLEDTLFANEVFLVQAFLAFNDVFQILLCSSFLHFDHPEVLKGLFPRYDPASHMPSSLWLQRVK